MSFKTSHAQEPNYIVTLPGNNKLFVAPRIETSEAGGQIVRIVNRTRHEPKSAVNLDATLTTSVDGVPESCRVRFGGADDSVAGPAFWLDLLATNQKNGIYRVVHPKKSGVLTAGSKIISSLDALLFLGRRYDFKRGGAQTFALLADIGTEDTALVTMTLEAVGKESLTLKDGTFPVRKMRFEAPLPFLPEGARKGFFYVGVHGEVLKCESPLLGFPVVATGAAKIENNGKTISLHFFDDNGLTLHAEKQANGWEIGVKAGRDYKLASETTDIAFNPVHIANPWRGRPFEATIANSEVRYTLEATPPEDTEVPMGHAWFVPDWFVTDRWEGEKGEFVLAPGEKHDGIYFPLFTGQTTGGAFTLTRLTDVGTVRHYHFDSKGKTFYEVYTDASRLIHLAGTDGTTITRDGWEKWVESLKPTTPTKKP